MNYIDCGCGDWAADATYIGNGGEDDVYDLFLCLF